MLRAKGEKPFRVWNFRVAGFISGFVFQGWGSGFQSAASRVWGSRTPQCDAETHQEINLDDAKMKIKKQNLDLWKTNSDPPPNDGRKNPAFCNAASDEQQQGCEAWTPFEPRNDLRNFSSWPHTAFSNTTYDKAVISHNKDTYPCYKPSSARRCIKHCSLSVFSLSSNQKEKQGAIGKPSEAGKKGHWKTVGGQHSWR